LKTRGKIVTLKKNKEFAFVYNRGKSLSSKLIVLVYFKNKYGGVKSGFSVSKKVGGAVLRNKIRRRLKESLRELIFDMDGNASIIFIARPVIAQAPYAEIKAQMEYLLIKTGFLQKKEQT